MIIQAPERLLPAAAIAAALLLLGLVLSRRPRGGWSLLSLLLRVLVLAGVVVYLLEPVVPREHRTPGRLAVAADLSASVARADLEEAWQGLRDIQRPPGTSLVARGFGDGVRVLDPAGPLPAERALASEPLPALASLLLDPARPPDAEHLLLLTDGLLPQPPAALRGLAPGASVVAVGGREAPRIQVGGLRPAGPPQPQEPVKLTLALTASRPARVTVEVSDGPRELERIPLELDAGAHTYELALPAMEPGLHVLGVRVAGPAVPDGRRPGAATALRVPRAPQVVVVAPEGSRPLVAAALEAQELPVRVVAAEPFLEAPGTLGEASVIVLDRVAAGALSAEAVLDRLDAHLAGGGGLLYLPRQVRGELLGVEEAPFLRRLPLVGLEPSPAPAAGNAGQQEPEEEGLAPPDADARKRERRQAPSLGLGLLIDVSRSMRGSPLRLAKEAAIAAAEVVHPEDKVAVIAFNQVARVVLELTKAGDRKTIADRISRMAAGGGTDIHGALKLADRVFTPADLSIKHVILLSDGETQGPPLKSLVEGMASRRITVSTVGCGADVNLKLMSDIALWGRGKFQPAFTPEEIPQVFTIEVERVIEKTGARRREREDPHAQEDPPPPPGGEETPEEEPAGPEPRPDPVQVAWPAPYLKGVHVHDAQGILGHHPARPRRGGWKALETESGDPVLVHGFAGDGRVMVWTLPLEGSWARHLVAWSGCQVLLSQAVRFLMPTGSRERFHVELSAQGRAVTARVLDRTDRTLPQEGLRLQVADERGRPLEVTRERLGPERWRFFPAAGQDVLGLRVTAMLEEAGPSGSAFVAIPPVPELAELGPDLEGLQAWAEALGGRVLPGLPPSLEIPSVVSQCPEPVPWTPVILLLGLFLADLLLKRLSG